ncbi:hypothetical protein FVE85_8390 [Porphyridium purpureum]|uniref:Inosine/uridine-preferring nucleoside hydrolase domain-containing protein n=1 Tax=Porphyridium purpureum TaxID=35688 RepID=A0A5J4YKU7_PORPP|nr:hypothetical protein FVE85_8390 [Porphyridium purpureum]|eukprot:POR0210..scf244_11
MVRLRYGRAMMALVVDTDVGTDDIAALALLHLRNAHLSALCTVRGLTRPRIGAAILSKVLLRPCRLEASTRLAVPAPPLDMALQCAEGQHLFVDTWRAFHERELATRLLGTSEQEGHSNDDVGLTAGLRETGCKGNEAVLQTGMYLDSADVLEDALRSDSTTVLALGPLTSIAHALEAVLGDKANERAPAKPLCELIWCGGVLPGFGNEPPVSVTAFQSGAEWNAFADIRATQNVLVHHASKFARPITLIPLNVSALAFDVDVLASAAALTSEKGHGAKLLVNAMELCAPQVYDLMAAVYYLQPSLFQCEWVSLAVDDGGRFQVIQRFQTEDEARGNGANIRAVIDADRDGIHAWLKSVLQESVQDTPPS